MNTGAIGSAFVSVILAVIGVAIIAVLVSSQAKTAGVIQAGGTAVGNVLQQALSPVTGGGGGLSSLAQTGQNLINRTGGLGG